MPARRCVRRLRVGEQACSTPRNVPRTEHDAGFPHGSEGRTASSDPCVISPASCCCRAHLSGFRTRRTITTRASAVSRARRRLAIHLAEPLIAFALFYAQKQLDKHGDSAPRRFLRRASGHPDRAGQGGGAQANYARAANPSCPARGGCAAAVSRNQRSAVRSSQTQRARVFFSLSFCATSGP